MKLEKLDENQKEFIQVKTLEGLQKTTIDGYYKVFLWQQLIFKEDL